MFLSCFSLDVMPWTGLEKTNHILKSQRGTTRRHSRLPAMLHVPADSPSRSPHISWYS